MTGLRLRGDRAASRPRNGMEVDGVEHHAVFGILQRHLHRVAGARANKGTGHRAVEGPEAETRAVGEQCFALNRLEFDLHDRSVIARDGRGNGSGIEGDRREGVGILRLFGSSGTGAKRETGEERHCACRSDESLPEPAHLRSP